mgnify:CR=1 FL=1
MRKNVEVFDYAGHICKALKKGVLLTTASDDKVNTMTIGWGTLGIEWNKPVFVAYVRESRYTRQMLRENPEFTVNIPLGEGDSRILSHCGKVSGRDADKIADLGLTLVPSEKVSVPGLKELPLTVECKVIYQKEQDLNVLPEAVLDRFYPAVNDEGFRDYHIAFYGEIVNSYIAEE